MSQTMIIVGGGETVYFLARQLNEKGNDVTIVNRNSQHCEQLFKQTDTLVIHGDGSSPDILEEAGARKADLVLALTPNDQDNLVICQIAQKIFSVPRTIAVVNDPANEDIFTKLGVTLAFSSTRIIAKMIEQHTHFDDVKRLMHIGDGKVQVADVEIHQDAPAVNQYLTDLALTDKTLIASIIRDDEVIIPRGGTQLLVGDHVLIISEEGHGDDDLSKIIGEAK